jgi:uncharacterized protein (TIGR02231 family)
MEGKEWGIIINWKSSFTYARPDVSTEINPALQGSAIQIPFNFADHILFMIRRIAFVSFLSLAVCSYAFGQQHVNSTIQDVTVYLQGALVKRTFQASLTPGTQEIVVEGLSNYVDQNSVTLEGTGTATILSVNYRINYLRYQEDNDAGKHIHTTLDSLRLKLSFVQNERLALEEELQMISANYQVPDPKEGAIVDDIEDVADFIRERVKDVRNKLTLLAPTEAELSRKVNDLQNQLNSTGNLYKKPSGEVVIKLSSTQYGRANFTLSYYVQNASWVPVYSLRADDLSQPITLNYDARVQQQTGEEWNDVKLTLATGQPDLGGYKPEFSTWFIDEYKPPVVYRNYKEVDNIGYKGEINNAPPQAYEWNMGDSEKKLDYTYSYTTANRTFINTQFEINLRYDIPSDGVGRHVRVQQNQLPATFEYISLPRLSEGAYLTARVTDWEQFNLIPGEANLFLLNTYVGKTVLDPNSAVDTMTLFFGKDDQIVVDRNKVNSGTKKQFLGSTKTESFTYVTTIRNAKTTPVTISVIDQLPVSANKDIEVELKDKGRAQYDPATGKLTWLLIIQPGDTQTVQFEYTVKYPKNMVVSGLY